ncbi:hypothetical protein MK292_04970, partial [Myxococcota bacterium]|nr:hypothetical protein [Myxococcota bacterium]
ADSIVGWSVMLQREVARRVVAGTGEAEYGSLSVLHELVVEVEAKKQVRAGNFYPKPKVDSTFLVMRPKTPAMPRDELRRVERLLVGHLNTDGKPCITPFYDRVFLLRMSQRHWLPVE